MLNFVNVKTLRNIFAEPHLVLHLPSTLNSALEIPTDLESPGHMRLGSEWLPCLDLDDVWVSPKE